MSNYFVACACAPHCKPYCQNIQCPKLATLIGPKPGICKESGLDYEKLTYLISRKRKLYSNTLGSAIGVVKTQLLLKSSDMTNTQVSIQRFATYLKAIAYLYLSPEYEWNTNVLNLILKEGQKLYSESELEEAKESNDEQKAEIPEEARSQPITNMYSSLEAKVERRFQLLGNDFGVELGKNFCIRVLSAGTSGDHLAPILRMDNLKKMLKEFFRKNNYCLVGVNGWYVLIWKVRQIYFVLDVCGRRLDTFESDKDGGAAMLICLASLDNVNHLITNLSGFSSTETCSLREMKVMMVGPDSTHMTPEYGERKDEFVIINPDYAYLKSVLHLSLKSDSPLRSRSALPVGVAALLASKIDHPATWTEEVLNRIFCYGVSVCRFCWEQCLRSSEPIDFDSFPNQFRLGQFLVSFLLQPTIYEGIWKCVPNNKQSDFRQAFEYLFGKGNNNLIFQINQQVYAVWRKNKFIYLLDPYRHRVLPADGSEPRMASMRVFRTLDAFLDVLNLILLSSNRTSHFYIHLVQVKKIDLISTKDCIIVTEEAKADKLEVSSLNESICLMIDDLQCLEELGGLSDDEEEDSLEEEEVPESEPEPEFGEEGESGGAIEDIGDIESSDDGGVDDRRNKNKNSGGLKKGKTGEKKKKRKRDMSERNARLRQDPTRYDAERKQRADSAKESKERSRDKTKGNLKTKDEAKSDSKIENKPAIMGAFIETDGDKGKSNKLSLDVKLKDQREAKIQEDINSDINEVEYKKSQNQVDSEIPQFKYRSYGYPGHSLVAHDIAVAASESGAYKSLCNLIRTGFKCADRILTITPYGNFVTFRYKMMCQKRYYLFDGCTCNVERFRHMDLNSGTGGLLCFKTLHETIRYVIDTRTIRSNLKKKSPACH